MASNDDSFNAEGPTVVAFETINNNNQQLGVSVTGTQCGVYGESMTTTPTRGTRPPGNLVPAGTGVHGRGTVFGVSGEDGLASVHGLNNGFGMGVLGISNGTNRLSGGTGILGVSRDIRSNARQLAAPGIGEGVIGVTEADAGIGVVGLSVGELKGTGPSPVTDRRTGDGKGTGVYGASGSGVGVMGMSQTGTGVHGSSEEQHGGVFESEKKAQLHLTPIDIFKLFPGGSGDPTGQISGEAGDLLAIIDNRESIKHCSLWFCVGKDSSGRTVWRQIAS